MKELSKGNTDVVIPRGKNDEVGNISNAINSFKENIILINSLEKEEKERRRKEDKKRRREEEKKIRRQDKERI